MTQQSALRATESDPDGNGRKLGAKGLRTRRQLIDATVALLETHGLRDVSVVDVARIAQTSPATFYVYFKGVPEVVLAALEGATQTSPELEALINGDWLAPGALERARSFVDLYTELWNRNRTIFVVRNLAAEEGDRRFFEARMRQSRPMMTEISKQVVRAQEDGRIPPGLSPRSCAGTVLMMLERLAAVGPISMDEGVRYEQLKAAAAYSVATTLGAREY